MALKVAVHLFVLIIALSSCKQKATDKLSAIIEIQSKVKLHKLNKLFVIGEFDGDGKQDTISQHNFSSLLKTEIDSSADPMQNEWTTVIKWFEKQDPDLYLCFKNKNQDTLHLGNGQGLYCLINLGDNNSDGKDEIGLVIDKLDFSNINTCFIYSLCNNKWTVLKKFRIHEEAFEVTSDQMPIYNDIKGYLEKRELMWVYKELSESKDDFRKMENLNLVNCN